MCLFTEQQAPSCTVYIIAMRAVFVLWAMLAAIAAAFAPTSAPRTAPEVRSAARVGRPTVAMMGQRLSAAKRAIKYPNAGQVHVVLKKDVLGTGMEGELAWINRGYLLNYLLPKGLAEQATPALVAAAEAKKAERQAAYEAERDAMGRVRDQLNDAAAFTVAKRVGENDAIFGSVTETQVVEMLRAKYGDVPEKCEVTLPEIKKLGSYTAGVKLHPEVKATMKIDVVAQ